MNYHDVANIFPMMSDEEFKDLVADIKQNGLLEPIWTYENQIIDGRNRYAACMEAGIQPKFRQWNGQGSLLAFITSLNLHRRHLNSAQKAKIAVNMLPFAEQEAKQRMTEGKNQYSPSQKIDYPSDPNAGKAAEQVAQQTSENKQ